MTAKMEVGEIRMSYAGGGERSPERTENISRLTFEHVEQLMSPTLRRLQDERLVKNLSVGPVHVSFETMDDDTIARTSALEIYRAILGAF